MKKIFITLVTCMTVCLSTSAGVWSNICAGKQSAEWYASEEAQALAAKTVAIQKNNGGWMKNLEVSTMSDSEYNSACSAGAKAEHSCLDNVATTQELRFLAKVYQNCKTESLRTSFAKGVNMILASQMTCGGWGQYWPRSGNGSYQDYITFNDDLMTNVMKFLRDVYNNKGDFADMVNENTRNKCKAAFDRGLECILKCQYDDNGTPAAWGAQHDTITYLPMEGRPHELPSISGSESASLLSFLMTVDSPSEKLQNAITTAIAWLDEHAYKRNASVQNCTNSANEADRLIFETTNCDVWARFIQLGGKSGTTVYNKFFTKLQNRGKSRSYYQNLYTYTYTEYEIASKSYDATKEYQPIMAIYDDTYPHLFYRFLYNYEDADSIVDWKGCKVPTSLNALRRSKYWFMTNDPYKVIHTEYPAWKQKMDIINTSGDATPYEISNTTNTSTNTGAIYNFNNGFTVSNSHGSKTYSTGKNNTVKYTQGIKYTINLPEGLAATKVTFYGYDNYTGTDSNIDSLIIDGKDSIGYAATEYVFLQKETSDSDPNYVSHTITLSTPAMNSLTFKLAGKQCGLIITVYAVDATGVEQVYAVETKANAVKRMENGKFVIEKNGRKYNAIGQEF